MYIYIYIYIYMCVHTSTSHLKDDQECLCNGAPLIFAWSMVNLKLINKKSFFLLDQKILHSCKRQTLLLVKKLSSSQSRGSPPGKCKWYSRANTISGSHLVVSASRLGNNFHLGGPFFSKRGRSSSEYRRNHLLDRLQIVCRSRGMNMCIYNIYIYIYT